MRQGRLRPDITRGGTHCLWRVSPGAAGHGPLLAIVAAMLFALVAMAAPGRGVAAPVQARVAPVRFRECRGCPEMVVVPPGRFTTSRKTFTDAGNLRPEAPQLTEEPKTVTIARSF